MKWNKGEDNSEIGGNQSASATGNQKLTVNHKKIVLHNNLKF